MTSRVNYLYQRCVMTKVSSTSQLDLFPQPVVTLEFDTEKSFRQKCLANKIYYFIIWVNVIRLLTLFSKWMTRVPEK